MVQRFCVAMLVLAALVPSAARADTITLQTPQVMIPPCRFSGFESMCRMSEEYNAQCPAGTTFGTWTDSYGNYDGGISIGRNGPWVMFEYEYNTMYYEGPAIAPALSYTCVSSQARAAAVTSDELSVHRFVMTRRLDGRHGRLRLACPSGERRIHSSSAFGFIHRTRVRHGVATFVRTRHTRADAGALLRIDVDPRLDRTHRVVAQLRLYCADQ
ncbi:MAG: hypothetical protein ACJ762_02355 [Solirubrobacteraceae bacterium]